MNDPEIRHALKRRVLSRYVRDPDSLVIDELGLRHGAARVDLVVVNGIIHGFEIKADRDTLYRLPSQASIYNSVLDRATLVAGSRHIEPALDLVPNWWGVIRAVAGPRGGIHFKSERRPRDNPHPDPVAIAKLLWREEALAFLEEVAAAAGVRSKPRAEVYRRLAEVVHLDDLRAIVRRQLAHRRNWRSGAPDMSSDG